MTKKHTTLPAPDIETTRVSDASKDESFWKENPVFFWTAAVGLLASWRFSTPWIYNRMSFLELTKADWQFSVLSLLPGFRIQSDATAIVHSGLASLLLMIFIFAPSLIRGSLVRWSLLFTLFVSGAATITAFFIVPYSPTMWTIIMIVTLSVVTLSAIPMSRVERVTHWLQAPVGSATPSGADGPRNIRKHWLVFLVVLLTVVLQYVLVPASTGRWTGKSQGQYWLSDTDFFILHMRDKQSPIHNHLIELMCATDDHYLVRDAIDYDENVHAPNVPEENYLDVLKLHGHAPILVPRSAVEGMVFVLSAKDVIDAISDAITDGQLKTKPEIEIRCELYPYRVTFSYRPPPGRPIVPSEALAHTRRGLTIAPDRDARTSDNAAVPSTQP